MCVRSTLSLSLSLSLNVKCLSIYADFTVYTTASSALLTLFLLVLLLGTLDQKHPGVLATKVRYVGVKSTKVHTCADRHQTC